jgi:hypothetical protein
VNAIKNVRVHISLSVEIENDLINRGWLNRGWELILFQRFWTAWGQIRRVRWESKKRLGTK